MNPDLLALVRERLVADGVAKKNWAAIVIAGCDGVETLEQLLSTGSMPAVEGGAVETASRSAAYITSVTVLDHPLAPMGSVLPGDEIFLSLDYDWQEGQGFWVRIQSITYSPDEGNNYVLSIVRSDKVA